MLTRKQMWRRVRGGKVGQEFSRLQQPSEEPLVPAANRDDAERSRGRKVTFNYVVRVVLVPCIKELRSLNEQLWWGADDYLDFR